MTNLKDNTILNQADDIYEGTEPYIFISYSHKNQQTMLTVKSVLAEHKIRYWYDNGLHSGDDWNLVIAKHLKNAAACLLILSPNSAESEYVKNELNFAMNHRVPIHTLLTKQFVLPLDIEMMTGRIQMIEMEGSYQQKLLKALPPEIFSDLSESSQDDKTEFSHPLFETQELLSDRQGTKIYLGKHKRLAYNCTVVEDTLQADELAEIENRLKIASRIQHSLFPKLIDYSINGHHLHVYQEYAETTFLDNYLSTNQLDEDTILSWTIRAVEGIAHLYKMNLAFKDFPRGSMTVTETGILKMLRLYHPYYGYIKFQEETKRYYFEKEIQELSILLAQLCLGKEPLMPIQIIEDSRFSKKFLSKINLIIQKCAKENGSTQYRNFDELLEDLKKSDISMKEKIFLKNRTKKLLEYENARSKRSNNFVSNDRPLAANIRLQSLEEEFGFEGTVLLQEASIETKPLISILMCSTGQALNFDKTAITIGKDTNCDMIWTQPYISRMHLKIIRNADQTYTIVDFNSTNGTYVVDVGQADDSWYRMPCGSELVVNQGARIKVGSAEIRIL